MQSVKVPKTYPHIPALQRSILEACLLDQDRISRKVELTEDDPRRIAPNIAPFPAPASTAEMVKKHKSRFRQEETFTTDNEPLPSTSKAYNIRTEAKEGHISDVSLDEELEHSRDDDDSSTDSFSSD